MPKVVYDTLRHVSGEERDDGLVDLGRYDRFLRYRVPIQGWAGNRISDFVFPLLIFCGLVDTCGPDAIFLMRIQVFPRSDIKCVGRSLFGHLTSMRSCRPYRFSCYLRFQWMIGTLNMLVAIFATTSLQFYHLTPCANAMSFGPRSMPRNIDTFLVRYRGDGNPHFQQIISPYGKPP